MTIDLRQHDELKGIASFLSALSALVLDQPAGAAVLEEPYAAILAAVIQAGQETSATHFS